MSHPPVHVTGMAWCTALGDGLDSVWNSVLEGHSGFKPVAHAGRVRNNLAAITAEFELPALSRQVRLTSQTVRRALADAGREPGDPGVRLVVGTSLGSYLEDKPSRATLSGWAQAAAQEVGIASAPMVVGTACSAGSDALLVGSELIRSGLARCCVCGGVDVVTESKRIGHSALGTMSPSMLRAFDIRHDGTLLGEGAGFLVLEATPKSGQSLAILRGSGSANDATGMTAADTTGISAARAVRLSLADAQLSISSIGLINAHGSGTPMNDMTEANAFRDLFGGQARPMIFATKGNFGHTLGATGAIEAIALVLALRSGRVPPIVGLEQPDPQFPLPLPLGGPVRCEARVGLSLTLGFGGFDTSLVFEVA